MINYWIDILLEKWTVEKYFYLRFTIVFSFKQIGSSFLSIWTWLPPQAYLIKTIMFVIIGALWTTKTKLEILIIMLIIDFPPDHAGTSVCIGIDESAVTQPLAITIIFLDIWC